MKKGARSNGGLEKKGEKREDTRVKDERKWRVVRGAKGNPRRVAARVIRKYNNTLKARLTRTGRWSEYRKGKWYKDGVWRDWHERDVRECKLCGIRWEGTHAEVERWWESHQQTCRQRNGGIQRERDSSREAHVWVRKKKEGRKR